MRVLFVCTGNICRSPSAEGVLRSRLRHAGLEAAVAVDSCGTHGYHTGDPPDPRAIQIGARRGHDIAGLRARAWRRGDADAFDLILAMEQHHARWLRDRMPAAARATVARLLDRAEGQPLRDVPDPYYGGLADFERMYDLIEAGVDGWLPVLAAAR
ncbi:MAG: low molecular weight protein-tyrosine-phosphatase [Alphaproteobacteria bacterium]